MNEIVNKYLLAGDKSIPEMHLKQHGFTCSACGPLTKNKERIKNFMTTGNTSFIYKKKLDMAYGKSEDLAKITQSDKVLMQILFYCKLQITKNTIVIKED